MSFYSEIYVGGHQWNNVAEKWTLDADNVVLSPVVTMDTLDVKADVGNYLTGTLRMDVIAKGEFLAPLNNYRFIVEATFTAVSTVVVNKLDIDTKIKSKFTGATQVLQDVHNGADSKTSLGNGPTDRFTLMPGQKYKQAYSIVLPASFFVA
jgi:hypothetical protein